MNLAVYKKPDGTLVIYSLRLIKKGFFTRYGIFDGDHEIEPEKRGEKFVMYKD